MQASLTFSVKVRTILQKHPTLKAQTDWGRLGEGMTLEIMGFTKEKHGGESTCGSVLKKKKKPSCLINPVYGNQCRFLRRQLSLLHQVGFSNVIPHIRCGV